MVANHPVHQSNSPSTTQQRKKKRPFLVTLLALVVLIIASTNLIRLIGSIRMWDFLASLPGVSPLYIALTGLFWVLVGFPPNDDWVQDLSSGYRSVIVGGRPGTPDRPLVIDTEADRTDQAQYLDRTTDLADITTDAIAAHHAQRYPPAPEGGAPT